MKKNLPPGTINYDSHSDSDVKGNGSGLKLYNFLSTATPSVRTVYRKDHIERFSGRPKTIQTHE